MKPFTRGAAFVLGAVILLFSNRSVLADSFALALFEQYLESLRQQTGIPGLSAAIVQDELIVWERGMGFEDVENSVRATPDTPYLVGDITETVSAVLLLRELERGRVSLDNLVTDFGASLPESGATIGHVLAHTSEGRPGAEFNYNPTRFASLTEIIQRTSRMQFRRAVATSILDPLAMRDSAPGLDLPNEPSAVTFDADALNRYRAVVRRLAKSYRVDKSGKAIRNDTARRAFDAAGGLVSTVRDLARFDEALSRAADDDDFLLQQETVLQAWTPVTVATGRPAPTGLGWFVQYHNGERLVWHFGLVPDAFSALIIKVPARNLTLILLANSDGLTAPFALERGDVTSSFFARLFLRIFV